MKYLKLFVLFFLSAQIALAQSSCFPEKPAKERLVNDFAGILDQQQEMALEQKLVAFNDTTSIQIAIVTVPSLCGLDASSMAYQIGEKWGVGNANFNSGVVVLVKPKEINSKGQVFIATGYGMEGVLPDAVNKRIVDLEMIPAFKKGDYFGGIQEASRVIMEISGGEYSADSYRKRSKKSFPVGAVIFLLLFVIIMFLGTLRRASSYSRRNDVGLWTALWLMGSMSSRHSGSYNNFSSGRGGFGGFGGGGGGGFGGFGGGSFGGGGAGGSW